MTIDRKIIKAKNKWYILRIKFYPNFISYQYKNITHQTIISKWKQNLVVCLNVTLLSLHFTLKFELTWTLTITVTVLKEWSSASGVSTM